MIINTFNYGDINKPYWLYEALLIEYSAGLSYNLNTMNYEIYPLWWKHEN